MQISTELKTNLFVPEELKDIEELMLFIKNNINKIDGVLYHKINGEIVEEIFIKIADFLEKEANNLEEDSRKNDCSFGGIRSCASKGLRSKSRVSKIICAFGFWACYGEEVGTCVENNCF